MDAKKVKSCSRDARNCFPDEVLAKILSFLPTKQAASTSLLSRRWRNLFTLMIQLFASEHHFYLDDSDLVYPDEGKRERKDVQESFKDFVDKTLSGCKSIKKLSLKCPQIYYNNPHTDQWVSLAMERGVVDLDLGFKMISTSQKTWFCPSAFSIKTLVKLTIGIEDGRKIWNSATGEVFLPVLKSLFLQMPWCTCESLCLILLPGCPILEELSLNYLPLASIYARPSFSISHKTLKRLTVHYGNSIDFIRLMLFDTPSLVYLDFSGSAPGSGSGANFSDSLVEAKLDVFVDSVVGPEQWKREYEACVNLCTIMNWMRNAKTLSLSSVSVKHMYSRCARLPFFSNLIKLQFESSTKEGWEVLRRLLNKSPKLETLVLKGLHCVSSQGVCISHNEVKVLEIYGFRGGDSEMRQVKCFLRGMQFLQVMKVEIDADDNNKLRLINHLLALPFLSERYNLVGFTVYLRRKIGETTLIDADYGCFVYWRETSNKQITINISSLLIKQESLKVVSTRLRLGTLFLVIFCSYGLAVWYG